MKTIVRLIVPAVLLSPLPAASQEAQQSPAKPDRFLPYIVKCPEENGGVFEGHFMNMLGQRVIVSVVYEDEDSPAAVETAIAESGEKMRPQYRVDPDKPKNDVQLSIRRKTLKMTDPLYFGLCLERGEGEPLRTRVLLDSNKMELLANGLSVDEDNYKPFQ